MRGRDRLEKGGLQATAVRAETRYTAKLKPDLKRDTTPGSSLEYRVTNYYLDDGSGQFTRCRPGSPRFRLRLYEQNDYCFGNIQLKYQINQNGGPSRTFKRVWNLAPLWNHFTEIVTDLGRKTWHPPPSSHPLYSLIPHHWDAEPPIWDHVRPLGFLRYTRLSIHSGESALTIDWGFQPEIVSRNVVLLEVKGDPAGLQALVETWFDHMRLLEDSKFRLLANFHAKSSHSP